MAALEILSSGPCSGSIGPWFSLGTPSLQHRSPPQGLHPQVAALSTAPSPTAWRKPATVCSPSPACRQANGAARARRMQLSDCTRSSNEGSKHRRCCRLQILPQCCSGYCLPQGRSTCAKSMAGRRSPQSPSINQLTSQPETIPSCDRRSRRAKFQPHRWRHQHANLILCPSSNLCEPMQCSCP